MKQIVLLILTAMLALGMCLTVSAANTTLVPEASGTGETATPFVDPQGEAFPVGNDTHKNTNSAGGILTLLFFLVCLFFVIEAVVHVIFKVKKKRETGGADDVSRE